MAGKTLSQETLEEYQGKSCTTCVYNRAVGGCRHHLGPLECLYAGAPYKMWNPAITSGLQQAPKAPDHAPSAKPDSGAHASYYEVQILYPKSGLPYNAECQDIIEALGMDFNEGNAFKALWRRAAARMGKVKKGNESPLYDAQKIAFYGNRILKKEEQNG